jgi:hypothetical protein
MRSSVAANASAVTIYELPHVGHECLLLVWRQQPDEFVPLIARHHRNVRAWHLSYHSSGSCLGPAIIWHPVRRAIGELEDLAHGQPVFGGSAHHHRRDVAAPVRYFASEEGLVWPGGKL